MSADMSISQGIASGPSNVTFVTPDRCVMSQTVGACSWTIEMTQSVFRKADIGKGPGQGLQTKKAAVKTAKLGTDNALKCEEIENSGNGR